MSEIPKKRSQIQQHLPYGAIDRLKLELEEMARAGGRRKVL